MRLDAINTAIKDRVDSARKADQSYRYWKKEWGTESANEAYGNLKSHIADVAVAAAPLDGRLWEVCREMLQGRLPLWGICHSYPLANIAWKPAQRGRWIDVLAGENFYPVDIWDGTLSAKWETVRNTAEQFHRDMNENDQGYDDGLRVHAHSFLHVAERRAIMRTFPIDPLAVTHDRLNPWLRRRYMAADKLVGAMQEARIIDADWINRQLSANTDPLYLVDNVMSYISQITRPFYNSGSAGTMGLSFSAAEFLANVLKYKLPPTCPFSDQRRDNPFMPIRVLGNVSGQYACDEVRILVQGLWVGADDKVHLHVGTMARQKGDWVFRNRAPLTGTHSRPA